MLVAIASYIGMCDSSFMSISIWSAALLSAGQSFVFSNISVSDLLRVFPLLSFVNIWRTVLSLNLYVLFGVVIGWLVLIGWLWCVFAPRSYKRKVLAARQRGVICYVFWSMMVQGGLSVGGEVRV